MKSDVHRTIFVHIQKTGGESVRAAFGQPRNSPDKHRTATELRSRYGDAIWADYFKFGIVRNPWDRLVSWWSMIDGMRARFEAGAKLNAFQTYILSNAGTFDEFVLKCDQEILDADGAKWVFRNQRDYLADDSGALIVDFVARFETLAADFSFVSRRALTPPSPLPHANISRHAAYVTYYTQELADLVRERFAKDIAAFGYEFGE